MTLAAAVAIVLGAVLTVVAWATASPPGSSPDEDFHITSIWCPSTTDGVCPTRVESGKTQVEVPDLLVDGARCSIFQNAESGACFEDFGHGTVWTSRLNAGGYVGTYYTIMHAFVGTDVLASVFVMRIVNGLLAVALLTALLFLLPRGGGRYLLYTVLPLAVPFAVYIVASVNPSSWAVTGVIVAFFGAYGLFQHVSRARKIGLVVVTLVGALMAAAARADSAAYVGVAIVALAVMFVRLTRSRGTLITVGALAAVLAIGLVGFFASGQSGHVLRGFSGGTAQQTGWTLLFTNMRNVPALLLGFSAVNPNALNWLDTPMPAIVWATAVALACGVGWMGLATMNGRKAVALGGTSLVYVALPLLFLQVSGAKVGSVYQARYTLPLAFVVMATALWSTKDGGAPRMSLTQTSVLVGGLAVAHGVALHTQIRRFVTGLDVTGFDLNRNAEWWHAGPSPMVTWAMGTGGFVLLLAALFLVRREPVGATPSGLPVPVPASEDVTVPLPPTRRARRHPVRTRAAG